MIAYIIRCAVCNVQSARNRETMYTAQSAHNHVSHAHASYSIYSVISLMHFARDVRNKAEICHNSSLLETRKYVECVYWVQDSGTCMASVLQLHSPIMGH